MSQKSSPNYLAGYPKALTEKITQLIEEDRLADHLTKKYDTVHSVRTDRALYEYVTDLKNTYLRKAGKLDKVAFDSKLHLTHKALGTHTSLSLVQGGNLKAKREIRVATMFKQMPTDFLQMIVVHELAHIKEREHNKAFYKLC